MGKREANKRANTQAIVDAALSVFCDLGYEAATITDIVNASGLSVGTFYNYFGDKESLLVLIIDQIMTDSRLAIHLAREQATQPENFIHDAFSAYINVLKQKPKYLLFIKKNPHAFRNSVGQGQAINSIFSDLERDMQTAIDAKLLPPFPVKLMTAAMIGASIEVFALADSIDESSLADFLSTLFIGGIEKFKAE